jgi:mRNA-degrading endonuclease toxin of MazEF toxin-antitoxin module
MPATVPAERHPCVVVQNDIFDRSDNRTSVVNVSQILTVDKAELLESTGQLSGAAARPCATDCISCSTACDPAANRRPF